MTALKTQKTDASVNAFLKSITDEAERKDALAVCRLMTEVTGEKPAVWGTNIVGFGRYHYVYESGREGDWFCAGFAPRKAALTLYIMAGFENYGALMKQLGKYKTGKACLYVKQLSDVKIEVLRQLIAESVAFIRSRYAPSATATKKPGKVAKRSAAKGASPAARKRAVRA